MRLLPTPSRLRLTLAVVRLGLYFALACFLLLQIALLGRREVEAGWGLAPSVSMADDIPFLGVTVQLEQYDAPERRAALARLASSGFGWVRQRLDWQEIEPTPGRFNWRLADQIVADIRAAGLTPVLVLDGSPAWARASRDRSPIDNVLAPPAHFEDFAHFAGQVADRYADSVRYYQIWDEPNIAPHWGEQHIEPTAYARLLRAASLAIRRADPDAYLLTAALAPTSDRGHTAMDEPLFLQRMYATGAAAHFDAVAAQPFGFATSPTDPRRHVDTLNFQRVALIRRLMVAAGDAQTPIWAVRYGWSTDPVSALGTVSENQKAEFAAAARDLAFDSWPWLAALGWAVDQPDAPPDDPIWGIALTDALLDAFAIWNARARSRPAPIVWQPDLATWLWLIGALALAVWRGYAAASLLDGQTWRRRYRSASSPMQTTLWVALLLVYYFATWPPLILICWLVAAWLIVAQPITGLTLAALVLPFHFQHKEIDLAGIALTIAPLQAVLLCSLPGFFFRARTERPRLIWLDALAGGFLAASLLSSLNVWHWPGFAVGLVDLVIAPLLLYASARLLLMSAGDLRVVSGALAAGGLIAAVGGLVGWVQGSGTLADGMLRLVGPNFSPNHTALYLERTLFVGLGLAVARVGWQRYALFVVAGIVGFALLLTGSRGAILLGVPAGLLVFVWLGAWFSNARWRWIPGIGQKLPGKRQRRVADSRNRGWFVLLAGAAIVMSSAYFIGPRLANIATVLDRVAIWQHAWPLWRDHLWLGVGPGGFFWRYAAYLPIDSALDPNLRHPHNLWLELGAIWGVLGLALFGLLAWHVMRQAARQPVRDRSLTWISAGLLAGLAAGLAHAQVDAFAALADLAGWNWLALGLLTFVWNRRGSTA